MIGINTEPDTQTILFKNMHEILFGKNTEISFDNKMRCIRVDIFDEMGNIICKRFFPLENILAFGDDISGYSIGMSSKSIKTPKYKGKVKNCPITTIVPESQVKKYEYHKKKWKVE